MSLRLIMLALVGAASGPALAQSQPAPTPAQPAPQAQPATQEAKPQMVKKVICRRADDEETTGSRLGSAPKVCKTIEVPAQPVKGERGQR